MKFSAKIVVGKFYIVLTYHYDHSDEYSYRTQIKISFSFSCSLPFYRTVNVKIKMILTIVEFEHYLRDEGSIIPLETLNPVDFKKLLVFKLICEGNPVSLLALTNGFAIPIFPH